jgi:hypothetical protein
MASSSPEGTIFPLEIVPGHAASQASAEHETETDTAAASSTRDLESEGGRTRENDEAQGRGGGEVPDTNAVMMMENHSVDDEEDEDHGDAFEGIPESRNGEQDRGFIPTFAVNEESVDREEGRRKEEEESTAEDYTTPRSPVEARSPGELLSFARMQHYETTAEATEAEHIYQQERHGREATQNHRQESMLGGQQGGAAAFLPMPLLVQGSPRSVYRRRESRQPNPQTGVAAVAQKRNLKVGEDTSQRDPARPAHHLLTDYNPPPTFHPTPPSSTS